MLALLAVAGPGHEAQAVTPVPQMVEKLRTGINGQNTRIVFDLARKTDFRAFHMDGPARVVVDFEAAGWRAAKSAPLNGGLIKSYRSGTLDDGLTRVIFDLARPAVIAGAFTLPASAFEKNRLVIDLMPASDNLFKSQQALVFGNRDLKGTGSAPKTVSSFADMQNRAVRDASVPDADAAVTGVLRKPATNSNNNGNNSGANNGSNGGAAAQDNNTDKPAPLTLRRVESGPKTYTVVIDAGHGGEDPGALGCCGIREKNITLAIAKALQTKLVETGRYRVVLTRSKDIYIKLRERVDISRRAKGDLFISIHADKIDRAGVRGASIYTLSQNASDKETERLAEQENNSGVVAGVDLAQENTDVAGILLDLAMREKMNESKLLSRFLEQSLDNNSVRLLPNSHRAAGFAVLKAPDIPSVLIETGFLSNPDEAKLLSTPAFQARIAAAITDGVDAYFRKIQALQKY
ncbi:MAG: N-acetylmuramoyl-L-alanine amidase [Micavibrio sp.]|nr:N-acetylmuramoyl-L-alanine amidase [Micavibrio sp.]